MNSRILIVVLVFAGGVGGGAAADFREFKKARKADPKVKFDLAEAWPRWLAGGLAGLGTGSVLAMLKTDA